MLSQYLGGMRRDGLNWTFSPVLDLSHDPRWGRCVESEGEDPYLAGQIGAAMVRGFQKNLDNTDNLIACPKHYIGYGAMEGGRDYHNSDISDYVMENCTLLPSVRLLTRARSPLCHPSTPFRVSP